MVFFSDTLQEKIELNETSSNVFLAKLNDIYFNQIINILCYNYYN